METTKLKKFAQFARKALLEQVEGKLVLVLDPASAARRESLKAVEELEKEIGLHGREQVVERVAYTWFNRFCALRYMDVNRYTRIGIVSPIEGQVQPEILAEAKMGHIDEAMVPRAKREQILAILDGSAPSSNPQAEAYQLLLVAACNHYYKQMPFMFEKISDYTELLIPDDLLSGNSVLTLTRETLLPANCSPEYTDESVEVIGWLYQFYISEKKDEVFAALKKGKKITPENIPAATQLFTPHWIVRYLVENSLGRLWMLNFPDSRLREQMDYYIEPEEVVSGQGLVVSKGGGEDGGQELSGSDCLAEVDGSGADGLRGDEAVSERGAVWPDESDTKSGSVDPLEHCGGAGAQGDSGVQELPFDSPGLESRSGNPTDDRSPSQLPNAGTGTADAKSTRRNLSHGRVTSEQTDHSPLATDHQVASGQWLVDSEEESANHSPLTTDHLKISSPEEIKICDPACGSGHMLTYAFDLLYAIYEEEGYQATDIPRLILENNLYGIEIDQRAGALAAFALTMKAREKDKRFFTRKPLASEKLATRDSQLTTQPNICVLENIQIDPEDLSAYMDKVGRDLFSGGLQGVVNQWEEADNFGSLIRPLVTDVSEVMEKLSTRSFDSDDKEGLFLAGVHQKVLKALKQADYLSPKYHVVVANPPYMGSKGYNAQLKSFINSEYTSYKSDLFAACIVRCNSLSTTNGQIGMMCPNVWMYISSHESLRQFISKEHSLHSLVELPLTGFQGATVQVCAITFANAVGPSRNAQFIRLVGKKGGDAEMAKATLSAIQTRDSDLFFNTSPSKFDCIKGSPIAYWIGESTRRVFKDGIGMREIFPIKQGMATSDNERFLRHWFEIGIQKIAFDCQTLDESETRDEKWYPYNKGGDFRKWYGNNELVVNWHHNGRELKEFQSTLNQGWHVRLKSRDFYFKPCITWTFISSRYFGVRYSHGGFIFDVGGSSAFPPEKLLYFFTAYFCSKLAYHFLGAINPTLNFQVENVAILPILETAIPSMSQSITQHSKAAVLHTKDDWNDQETSWEFTSHPLFGDTFNSCTISDEYGNVRDKWHERTLDVLNIENQINELFITEYQLHDDVDAECPVEQVTLTCNPHSRYGSDKSDSELEALLLADTMREFISYAVGCMFGRYSLDIPGLVLANQGDGLEEYSLKHNEALNWGVSTSEHADPQDLLDATVERCSFLPDWDNVIPLLDGDWFTDDISERFKEFLKVTFGTEHYEENLTFLENALYPKNLTGSKRKDICDYFLKEFYNHHIKLYKKRPIYWLFSSPKGTFNALIYMHRYRPDTVSVVLNDYLREFQTKLTAKLEHLQSVADSGEASKTEKTKALKEITKLKKQLKELVDYERDILYPLASEQIEIDLDDGVKVNYNKFGKALKKVTGLTGK